MRVLVSVESACRREGRLPSNAARLGDRCEIWKILELCVGMGGLCSSLVTCPGRLWDMGSTICRLDPLDERRVRSQTRPAA